MSIIKKIVVIAVLSCLFFSDGRAQTNLRDSVSGGFLINLSYAAQFPAWSMAKRFGFNSNIGIGCLYKTHENWLFGAQAQFLFGNQLRETGILDSIATADGNLISNSGDYPQITYFERGYIVEVSAGKLIHWGPNVNSGIVVMGSVGYMHHQILIEVQNGEYTPQLTGDYLNGYDRLTAGVSLSEYVGYMFLSPHKTINFFAGFEFTQGFTKSLRYDFDLKSQNTSLRHDLLNGFRVGWILPIYTAHRDNSFYTY